MTDRSSATAGDSENPDEPRGDVFDLVGIGFGPANLALAIAIEEHNATDPDSPLRATFFERRPDFAWHPGMILEGATMQIAFPKDLVTFRNPTSSYSFFAYLHERGRLADFVNHQTFFPTRHEFQDYLRWAADRVTADVRYGTEITAVEAVRHHNGAADLFAIHAADGSVVHARSVVVGVGLRAQIPRWATESARCFHNHQFLFHLDAMPEPAHQRFAVVGAGQSAAEVVQYLHAHYPQAEVHSIFNRFGYSPADDSPYANRIFDPSAVDELHGASPAERERVLTLHRGTNYSVVAPELIEALYATEYRERVSGRRRLFMRRASEIVSTTESAAGIEIDVRNNLDGAVETLMCDAVVLATGFEPAPLTPLLGDLAPDGPVLVVDRDYRLPTPEDIDADIYLQGGTEKTHGLTSSLLSNAAVRAGEILASVLGRRELKMSGALGVVGELDRIPDHHTYATSEAR
ncbi:SidA/IucD/PvdA family monooxygenase [Rhodococcus sp. (in: high G+C Gram-positive bacteria)]|uniref:lysine N(6)-hydroxylase/L-ornithine N(5)-oxygenase family protein n=1 Tax=Rhodococcus sp. TaxID=1831 RepID=UPI0019F4D753|nr:SidA/IucD/PvdA family monooxygenase [Rhodococcus sp. (in: high G+C Gram-positive bacteria)]MBF0660150.1 lysine N(6)-hydroxylase/L-ornithine N(5)-oxygenase family protein [Rhodococcus sp. (in: high G+C Gram-positive bacteria)]